MDHKYDDCSSDDEVDYCFSHHYSSASDSEDDHQNNEILQMVLQQHEERKKKVSKCGSKEFQSDPFEEEMACELNNAMIAMSSFGASNSRDHGHESSSGISAQKNGESSSHTTSGQPAEQYDTVYFDSDDDENNADVQQRRKTVSDADLLYDPTLDDQDQLWMDQHRRSCFSAKTKTKRGVQPPGKMNKEESALPESDAVLNCPGCLTMLCTDCQRHTTFSNQYRAMFVFNCRVDCSQRLKFPTKITKSEQKKNKKKERQLRKMMKRQSVQAFEEVTASDDLPRPVQREEYLNLKDDASSKEVQDCNDAGKSSENEIIDNKSDGEIPIGDTGKSDQAETVGKIDQISSMELDEDVLQIKDRCREQSTELQRVGKTENYSPKVNSGVKYNGDVIASPADRTSTTTKSITTEIKVSSEKLSTNPDAVCGTPGIPGPQKRNSLNSVGPSKKVRFGHTTEKESTLCFPSAALLQSSTEELFHPVMCRHCNTKVAVFDKDEIYHFFNVITSY
ncbi:uncharacterized protein LOC108672990 [Hyalella azteca]|uniref:Uncharacterized protein LOC108672990 n=1 Tax=Hyalella azteca TaxID=294128 RepID=A0A8B7NRD0_HYAAZ|nr:uncharacterized protein LOC108672990 [Hyalella azteca]